MNLDELRDYYDELADPIDTIKMLIHNTTRSDLKQDLLDLILPYEDELAGIEEEIEQLEKEEYEAEMKEREIEYNKVRL